MTETQKKTPLTAEMIDSFPAVDPHVHVPGTISPATAWELGLRNKLIHMVQDKEGRWSVFDGPEKIGQPAFDKDTGEPIIDEVTKEQKRTDPVQFYSRLFISKDGQPLTFDADGKPIDLDYNYHCIPGARDAFTNFDAIQATTQGHRWAPGGIQDEGDYHFVMQEYLKSCKAQNIAYAETSQNITIAKKVLYPELPEKEARKKFFHLCKQIVGEFEQEGVALRFTHCANKTGDAAVKDANGETRPLSKQANDWADWLQEAKNEVPGVFVGMTTAGNEKKEIEIGGPRALVEAYERVRVMELGCEGHYGEGAGVEHMMKAFGLLPKDTRFSHGFQVIELQEAIDKVLARGIPLIMSPCININLEGVLHFKDGKIHHKLQRNPETGELLFDTEIKVNPNTNEEETIRKPRREDGIKNRKIENLEDHPFWTLMRDYHLPIGLMSDDPQQGGIDYKIQAKLLAGIAVKGCPLPPLDTSLVAPLTAEELALCNLNAIQVAFCEPELKAKLVDNVIGWMEQYGITVEHPSLTKRAAEKQSDTGWRRKALAPAAPSTGAGASPRGQ